MFGASRKEIRDGIWTIPGERAKNGHAHIVPFSKMAIGIIEAIPETKDSDKLFAVPDNLVCRPRR